MTATHIKTVAETTHHAGLNHNKKPFFSNQPSIEKPFFSPATIQPKLKIGNPDDKYERQADRVADAVVNSSVPNIQQLSMDEDDEVLQMKCCGCDKEEKVQMKAGDHKTGSYASSEISQQIKHSGGRGSKLPSHINVEMSKKIGADFSGVNIHTGPKAAELNQSLGARAFTHGNDIYFNSGEYSPGTSRGKHLLAHELTHVVQQSTWTFSQSESGNGQNIVQRKPMPKVPLGDYMLMFNPVSSVTFTPPGGNTEKRKKNEATETFTFTDIPRGSSGQVELNVAMQWFSKPQPAGNCDLCGILEDVTFLGFRIFPDFFIQECRNRVRVDPGAIKDILLDLMEIVGDPCGKLVDLIPCPNIIIIEQTCEAGKFGLKAACRAAIAAGATPQGMLLDAIKKIRKLADKCHSAPTVDPMSQNAQEGPLAGGAQSKMRAAFFSDADGSMHFYGMSPAPFQFGEGAMLFIPVAHLNMALPRGGEVAQQPTVATTTGKPGVVGRQFTVIIQQPADASYECIEHFGPFKVSSDRFEQDDQKHQEIRNWYFGLHPQIRQDIEENNGLIRITGRASKTGSQAYNMMLAEKRAERVQYILSGMTGSDARSRLFYLGELGAQTPGCDGPFVDASCEDANERRVDVVASGNIPGAGVLQHPCFGHQDEATPSGATQPFFEAGPLEDGEFYD